MSHHDQPNLSQFSQQSSPIQGSSFHQPETHFADITAKMLTDLGVPPSDVVSRFLDWADKSLQSGDAGQAWLDLESKIEKGIPTVSPSNWTWNRNFPWDGFTHTALGINETSDSIQRLELNPAGMILTCYPPGVPRPSLLLNISGQPPASRDPPRAFVLNFLDAETASAQLRLVRESFAAARLCSTPLSTLATEQYHKDAPTNQTMPPSLISGIIPKARKAIECGPITNSTDATYGAGLPCIVRSDVTSPSASVKRHLIHLRAPSRHSGRWT